MNVTYSCKRVAELISQSLDEPLGLVDQVLLRVHLSMCSDCTNVEQQLRRMGPLAHQLPPLADDASVDTGRPTPPGDP